MKNTTEFTHNGTIIKILSKEEKKELLKKLKVIEILSFWEICTLILWELFNKTKFNLFFESLKIGKSVKIAYRLTKSY